MSNDFISGTNTTISIDGTAIGDLDSLGAFGGSVQVVTHQPLDGEVYKRPGSRNNGTLSISGAYVPGDTGQAAMQAAFDARTVNTYTIELDNAVTPGTGNGTQFTFDAIVTQFETQVAGPDDKVALNATIEISGAITKTAAT